MKIAVELRPDLSIVDVDLPITNGITLAAAITKQYPGRKGHKYPILAKPAHPDEILKAARELLAPKTPRTWVTAE